MDRLASCRPEIIEAVRTLHRENLSGDEKAIVCAIIGGGEFVLKTDVELMVDESVREIANELIVEKNPARSIIKAAIVEASEKFFSGDNAKLSGFLREPEASQFLGHDKQWLGKQRRSGNLTLKYEKRGGFYYYDVADLMAFHHTQINPNKDPVTVTRGLKKGLRHIAKTVGLFEERIDDAHDLAVRTARQKRRDTSDKNDRS